MLDLFAKSVNSESENLEAVDKVTGYLFSLTTHLIKMKNWKSALLGQ